MGSEMCIRDRSDIVICDASDGSIQTRATCRKLLRQWCEAGVEVYSKANLHSKMIVFDHESAFVGSANFSEFAERRIESGIFTSDPIVVAECEKFILDLIPQSEPVDDEFLKRIERLKLKPRKPQKPISDASTKSTLQYWFFKGTSGHSKKAQEIENSMRSQWNEGSADETTEDYDDDIPDDENPLSFHALRHSSPRWVKGIAKGDRVFWCYDHDDYGWIVQPPRTVTSITKQGKSVLAGTEGRYWDKDDSIRLDVLIERLGLRKNISLGAIAPSNSKLIQLLKDWSDLVD